MAGPGSNFDAEIKAGMKPRSAKSSTNSVPSGKPPAASQGFNRVPKAGPKSQGTSGAPAQSDNPVNLPPQIGDTHQAMLDAGQAHMSAIHAHINNLKNGGGM